MLDKIAKIFTNLNGMVVLVIPIAIVLAVFIVGVLFSFGGDLGKFKKGASFAIKAGTPDAFNASAKNLMPLRVRKQYKAFKLGGGKPDDHITQDVCVYDSFNEGVASRLPNIVTVAGLLSVLLSLALASLKGGNAFVVPVIVTVFVMIIRLAAGLISAAVLKSGLKTYDKYVAVLSKCIPSAGITAEQPVTPVTSEIPVVDIPATTQEPTGGRTIAYDATFGEPERINVELADEEDEGQTVYITDEPVAVPVNDDVAATVEMPRTTEEPVIQAEPVIAAQPAETPEQAKARARAEAIARLRAEQAQRNAANGTSAQPISKTAAASAGNDVFAKVDAICANGAPIPTMKEVALQLQKERSKSENQTPEMQAKFKEALTKLLKAMNTATKK